LANEIRQEKDKKYAGWEQRKLLFANVMITYVEYLKFLELTKNFSKVCKIQG
jgi:hypothetical protein